MKILVIGGAGYIGSHVVLNLLENKHQVWVYDNLSKGSMVNVLDRSRFIKGDILDEELLNSIFEKGGFDAVIHLGALKAAGESMTFIEKYSKNNINGTINILNAMSKYGVRYIVFSSSAAVYGEPEYTPIDEDHPKNPQNYYGFTKLEIERILYWYDKIKGIKSVCLRYFNAVGYDAEGKIKGLEKDPQNLLPVIMEVLFSKRDELKIFGSDYKTKDGTCVRDYIHVSDLASAHLKSLYYLDDKKKSDYFNLASENGISVLEMVEKVKSITQRDLPYTRTGKRNGDPAVLEATSKKARELLNWSAEHSDIDNIIKSTFEIYKSNFED